MGNGNEVIKLANCTEHLRDIRLSDAQRRAGERASIAPFRECSPKVFTLTRLTDLIV